VPEPDPTAAEPIEVRIDYPDFVDPWVDMGGAASETSSS